MPLRPDLPPAFRNTALFGQSDANAPATTNTNGSRQIWGGRKVVNWRPVLALTTARSRGR